MIEIEDQTRQHVANKLAWIGSDLEELAWWLEHHGRGEMTEDLLRMRRRLGEMRERLGVDPLGFTVKEKGRERARCATLEEAARELTAIGEADGSEDSCAWIEDAYGCRYYHGIRCKLGTGD